MKKMKKILCPVDFFPASLRAVSYAARFAASTKAIAYLLHVMSPVIDDPYSYSPYMPHLVKTMRQRSAHQMEQLELKLRRAGISTSSRLKVGNVYDEIEREIGRVKPDLVLMGTHGRRRVKRWFLGSITEKMLRHSPVPVLVIPPGLEKPLPFHFRRILVTTDLSEDVNDTLAYALTLADKDKSQITLLHVVDDTAADISGNYRGALLHGVEQHLDDLVPVQTRKRYDILTSVDIGRANRIIPQRVRSNKIDLLVMSIQEKGVMDRAIYGSTAEQVVHAAGCPVLLIPPIKRAMPTRKGNAGRARVKAA